MVAIDNQSLLIHSSFDEPATHWQTATEYEQSKLAISPAGFASANNVLLTQPNLNSSNLFRADILYDSAKQLKTPIEHEEYRGLTPAAEKCEEGAVGRMPETFAAFALTRTVVRKLIPRNEKLDRPLLQSCHVYEDGVSRHLVVYLPHVDSREAVPWYHPPVKALAYLYEAAPVDRLGLPDATLSVHLLPFEASRTVNRISDRLHRTLLSLLHTLTRLATSMSRRQQPQNTTIVPIAPKDNIIPQHRVQNTYARLKQQYSSDLISSWIEKTEPSKHVFEDLSIAAFLIELWRQTYGVQPRCERPASVTSTSFRGFVDIACGNGVLVYVLLKEGYEGWGFDARRRRTWEIFPGDVQEHLLERVLVPEPYLRTKSLVSKSEASGNTHPDGTEDIAAEVEFHNGIFQAGTFIISNHADELTPWTPILAALSDPTDSLPWLAIPCCSHALSGARHRYPVLKATARPEKQRLKGSSTETESSSSADTTASMSHLFTSKSNSVDKPLTSAALPSKPTEEREQPASGDLKVLRTAKANAGSGADQKSMYACLTAKVIALAEELHTETERTLMRIPSTRNIGIIGGRARVMEKLRSECELRNGDDEGKQAARLQDNIIELEIVDGAASSSPKVATKTTLREVQMGERREVVSEGTMLRRIEEMIERECKPSGGVAAAAEIWIDRAKSLQTGQGRGKVNSGKAHG